MTATPRNLSEILCVTIQPEEIVAVAGLCPNYDVFTITRVTLVKSDTKVHVYRACVGLRYGFTGHAWDWGTDLLGMRGIEVRIYEACVGLRYRFTTHAWD